MLSKFQVYDDIVDQLDDDGWDKLDWLLLNWNSYNPQYQENDELDDDLDDDGFDDDGLTGFADDDDIFDEDLDDTGTGFAPDPYDYDIPW